MTTVYVRDGSGNVMSIYEKISGQSLKQKEAYIYGSSRLGMAAENPVTSQITLDEDFGTAKATVFTRGNKFFELSNHLGNVLATVSDKKLQHSTDNATVDYFEADIASASDYFPSGMLIPGRAYGNEFQRHSYQSSEKDNELSKNTYTTFFRELDTRIGRWWAIDPVTNPNQSPYATMDGNPIANNDQDGDCTTCPGKAKPGDRFTEHHPRDNSGYAPNGDLIYYGDSKKAHVQYTNLGTEDKPEWRINYFFREGENGGWSWNNEKRAFLNNNGEEFSNGVAMAIFNKVGLSTGRNLSEAMKNAANGEPLKDTKTAYEQYKASGGSGGVPGFLWNGITTSVGNWADDMAAGGNRRRDALIGAWRFSADVASGSGVGNQSSLDLLSFKGGWGPFGRNGLRVGNFRVDALYRNPNSGVGHGTLLSVRNLRTKSFLRFDYGTLHTGGVGWHSSFRMTVRGTTYGSSARGTSQRPFFAPFVFWKYPQK